MRRALDQPPRVTHIQTGRTPAACQRHAAVAMVIANDMHVLLMTRAAFEGDPWSGHIAFPGGHVETTDSSPLAAAIREANEELGLTLEEKDCLGPLNPVQTPPAPDLMVHPFVFFTNKRPEVVPDHREVQHAHWLNLNELMAGTHRDSFLFSYNEHKVRLPCVHVGEERLWGLSLRIVDDLLHRLDGRGMGLERPSH